MAKHCTICSQSEEIQQKILEWHKDGKSFRDIETLLENKCQISISNSSIRRHLVNCLEEKERSHKTAPSFQDIINAPKPDGADMHNALCHILHQGIEIFFQRMKETGEKTTPYSVHLETYRCLDMLIKMLEALYPNSAQLAENKRKEKSVHNIRNLTSSQQRIFYKLYTNYTNNRTMTDQQFKEFVLQQFDA
jgi:hypothetical protein